MTTPYEEGRREIFHVDTGFLLEFINAVRCPNENGHMFAFLSHWRIPEDAAVDGVYYNHSRRCLDVIVSHKSFSIVPDGECCPSGSDGMCEVSYRRVVFVDKEHKEVHARYKAELHANMPKEAE